MTEQEKRDLKLQNYLRQVVANILFTAGSVDYTQADANNVALQKIANILDQFGMEIEQIIPPMLLQDYFGGVDEASKALSAAGATTAATTTGVATTGAVSVGAAAIVAPALTEAGKISKPFQKVIHLKAVEKLINDTMGDLRAAIEGARQSSASNITQALEEVNADLTKGLITGDPRKAIQKRVMETFARNGVTAFVTSDGKNLPLDFYSMTVTRTKSRNATVQGSANRYKDAGQDLVKITGNGDGCKECSRFRDLVVSLTGATPGYPVIGQNGIRLAPYHPNCRCGHRVFILRFATPAEIEEAKARNAKYHPTKDMRTPAQKASYEREQRLRAQANAAKKQYMNYQSVLGAEAPKSLGAFKAMKRSNSLKYQELKSAYMSEAQAKANRKSQKE